MVNHDRVALFVPGLFGGGAERMMIHIANRLAEDYTVDFLVNTAEGEYTDQLRDGITLRELQAPYLFAAVGPLARYLWNQQPSTLLSTMDSANLVSIWAKYLARSNATLAIRIPNTMSRRTADYETLRYKLIPWLARLFYPLADEIIAISEGVAVDLAELTGLSTEELAVIYNPVVTDDLHELADEPVSHPWLTEDVPVILGAGRLVNQKDFATLIRAHARLSERRDVRLLIIGKGENEESLRTLVDELGTGNSVSFPGFASNPYAYMSRADVFALSSAWEGFGNVLVEAMACETPVVATDCESGPAEILENGAHGPLVPVGDADRLAGALAYLLDNPTNEQQLAHRADDFTLESIIPQYRDVLDL